MKRDFIRAYEWLFGDNKGAAVYEAASEDCKELIIEAYKLNHRNSLLKMQRG